MSLILNELKIANKLTLNSSANLGIGKTTPNAPLDVNGNAIISGSFITTGNVGIGTSPSYRLDVAGAGGNNVAVRLTPDNGRVRFYGYDILGYNTQNIWMISNDPTNRFTLGTSWDWDYSCDLVYTPGTAGAVGGALLIGQINKNSATFTHGYTALYTNGAEKLRLTRYGTLLVGDNTEINASWYNNGIGIFGKNGTDKMIVGYLGSSTSGALIGAHNSALNAWAVTNINGSQIIFRIGETEKMRIDANGNVGIGTSSPNSTLQIGGTTTGLLTVGTLTNNWGGVVAIGTTDGNGIILSKVNAANDTNRVLTLVRDDSQGAIITGYKPAGGAGDVGFSIRAAGSYISSSLGIGTNNPSALLHTRNTVDAEGPLFENTGGRGSITVKSSGTSNSAYVQFGNASGNSRAFIDFRESLGFFSLNTSFSGGYITFNTDVQVERVRITSTGNVGIGTTGPRNRLEISGSMRTGDIYLNSVGGSANPKMFFSSSVGSSSINLEVLQNGTVAFMGKSGSLLDIVDNFQGSLMSVNDVSGFPILEVFSDDRVVAGRYNSNALVVTGSCVGIGTSSPSTKLHISGSSSINENLPVLFIEQNFSGANGYGLSISRNGGGGAAALALGADGSGNGIIAANNADLRIGKSLSNTFNEYVRINSYGSVGIGTTAPGTKLNILVGDGTSNGTAGIRIGGTNNYQSLELGIVGAYGGMIRSYGNDLNYYSGHWITVGTTATEDHSHYWYTSKTGSSNWSTAKMALNQDGNLGIGTSSPSTALHVSGSAIVGDISYNRYGNYVRIPFVGGNLTAGTVRGYYQLDSGPDYSVNTGDAYSWKVAAVARAGSGGNYNSQFEILRSSRTVVTDNSDFVINKDGNIGIATTTPAYKLDVNGTANFSSNIYTSATMQLSATEAIRLYQNNAYIAFYNTANNTRTGYIQGNTGASMLVAAENGASLLFYTAGSERARIDTSGNLGIGSTTLYALFHVGGSATGNFRLDSNGSGGHYYSNETYPRLGLGRDLDGPAGYISFNRDGTQNTIKVAITSPANNEMAFYVGTTEKIRMNSNGNLGIGTTNPAAKFHISSGDNSIAYFGPNASSGYMVVGAGTNSTTSTTAQAVSTNGNLHLDSGTSRNTYINYYSGTSTFINSNGGSVGIGTASPGSILDVQAVSAVVKIKSTTGTNSSYINFENNLNFYVGRDSSAAGSFGGSAYASVLYSSGAYPMEFWTNGSRRFVIASDGNVGVGTTSPAHKFHVNNNGGSTSAFYVDVGSVSGATTLFEHTGTNSPVTFRLKKSGYSGAGGTYGLLYLHMNDNTNGNGSALYFTLNDSAGTEREYAGIGAVIRSNTAGGQTGDLILMTSDGGTQRAEKMRIISNGNVGIGTTSPSQKLEVNGNASIINAIAANVNGDGTNLNSGISLWGAPNSTTSLSMFKSWASIFGRTNTVLTEANGYGTYHIMDSSGRGWVWRYSSGGSAGTNVASLRNDTGQMSLGTSWDWSGGYHAQLNIAAGQGSATTYRDIDLHGSWSGGEGHAITATYSTGANNIVGQIVFQHDSPGSRIKFGRLYHSADRSGYPLELISTGADVANLVLNTGNVGISVSTPLARLHVVSGSGATSVGSLPSGVTGLMDSSGNNYLLFRNTADNNTYAGLLFQDNNVGAYIAFRNYAGSGTNDGTNGDALYYGTYTDHIFQAGSTDTVGARTEIFRIKQSGKTVFYAGVWHNSSDGYERFHFGSADTTYFKAPNSTFVFRNSSDSAIMTLNTTGLAIGSSNPSSRLEVATANDTTTGEPSAWDNKFAVFGTGGSSTAGGVFISYDQTNNRGYIGALSPSSAWRNLILQPNAGSGNVGIGTKTPAYKLEVNGSFAATTKSFVIPHPTKTGKRLVHGVTEGPEHSVFVRGKTKSNKIILPEYWINLVDETTITVQLTSIGKHQNLAVIDVNAVEITIENQNTFNKDINCYYLVHAERKDIEKLQVEV